MTIAASHAIARRAVEREQMRRGLTQEQAAGWIAGRIREAPGTILRLVKGQAKRIDRAVSDKLTAFAVRQLETEIQGLEHELAVLRRSGADPRSLCIAEIEGHLAHARRLMERRP